jgi:hypothetical protein
VDVVIKSAMQVEHSSNSPGEHSFMKFVHRGSTSRGQLVYAKLCVHKHIRKSQTSGATVERTLLHNFGKDNVHRNCMCGGI